MSGSKCRSRRISGIDGLLHYWREHSAVSEEIVRNSGMPTLILDPRDGDWHDRRAAIAHFLGVSAHVEEPSLSEADLCRLVGKYREGSTAFTINLRGNALVLDGLLWPSNRLLPVAPTIFEAESWPLVLRFVEVGRDVRTVRIDGPLVAGRRLAGDYDKVG